jgi:hypothetical protein
MSERVSRFVNALGFQAGWWACVTSVRHDWQGPALLGGAGLLALHLIASGQLWAELRLMGIVVGAGIAVDMSLQALGVLRFEGWRLGGLSPFWLWLVWALFAMTLNASLAFLQRVPVRMNALLGAVFGTLSYVAGARLGAAVMAESVWNLSLLALAWACVFPMTVIWGRRLVRDERA